MLDNKIINFIQTLLIRCENSKVSLGKLSKQEKKYLVNYVLFSKIEHIFLEKIGKEESRKELGYRNFQKIENSRSKRIIKTLENIRFMKLIDNSLKNNGIEYIFLKGVNGYRHNIFSFTDRGIIDIDIFIKKGDLKESLKVFESLGFDTYAWKNFNSNTDKIFKNPTIKHQASTSIIDIHTNIINPRFSTDMLENKSHYCSEVYSGEFCSVEYYFIHCFYHGTVKSIFNEGPIFIFDLLNFLEIEKLDWKKIHDSIKKLGLQNIFYDVFACIKTFYQLPMNLEAILLEDSLFDEKDMKLILFSAPLLSNISIDMTNSNESIFTRVLRKFYDPENYMLYSSHKINSEYYLKYLLKLIRLNFTRLSSPLNNKTINGIRKKYKRKYIDNVSL